MTDSGVIAAITNQGYAYFDDLELTSKFVAGSGVDWRQLGPQKYRVTVWPEPDCRSKPGYDYYFCVKLTNLAAALQVVTLEIRRPDQSAAVDWQPSRVPLFVSADFHSWYVLERVESAPDHREFKVEVTLAPGQSIYLTNSLPYPSSWMHQWLQEQAATHADLARVSAIGASVLGREISLLTITDPQIEAAAKDRVLVTSGFHPAEPDWLATTTIIESLLGNSDWAQQTRRNFIVDLVPQVNVDGYDLGTNAANARGINMYWDFRPQEPESSPEAYHLWRWMESHPPSLYLDFHAYVYQLYKDFQPYIRPASDYPPAARPAVRAIDAALIDLCEGRSVHNRSTNDPQSPAAQITTAFGTITYPKFHLHLVHGVPACRKLGLDVFRAVVDGALPYRPLFPKTTGANWKPGATDHALGWLVQGDLPVRVHCNVNRVAVCLGWRKPVRMSVPEAAQQGLACHWQDHKWSRRDVVDPVIVIGAKHASPSIASA